MLLFTILLIGLLSLIIAAALIIGAGSLGFVLAFGDVIACTVIIILLAKLIISRRK